jgi:paraquat-inducible protein A
MAGALLSIPANVLPVMTISKMGQGGPSTIIGGTGELLERGFWGLAVLVFVASVLIPLFKLVVLSVLAVSVSSQTDKQLRLRTQLYRVVDGIGRWSMLDIFATMMLVALARFGWVGSVVPGAGATAFCAVVIATMLAAQAFDPRLMWDAAGRNVARQAKPGAHT